MALSITTLGLAFPTSAEIVASLQARLKANDSLITNLNSGGVAETVLESIAVALGSDAASIAGVTQPGAYALLQTIASGAYISSASGAALDLKVADVGITRKVASAASGANGQITLPSPAGSGGQIIPAGALIQAEVTDPTQTPVVFATTAAAVFAPGATVATGVPYLCTQTGLSTNQPVNAINIPLSGLSGASFTNLDAATGGLDTEQDDSPNGGVRARGLAAVPNAAQCTGNAIVAQALKYAGISNATILMNTYTDFVTFTRGMSQLIISGSSAAETQLQNDLNTGLYRAAGDQVIVSIATQFAISISLTVIISSTYVAQTASQASVVAALQAAIQSYVNGLNIGSTVYLSEIVATAQNVAGIKDVVVSSVIINGANADLAITLPNTPYIAAPSNVTVTSSLG